MRRSDGLREYIYIDRSGINSLISQLSASTMTERTVTEAKQKTGRVRSGFGFGGLFKGIMNADASIEREHENGTVFESHFVTEPEQKIARLLKYLADRSYYFDTLTDAVENFSNEHTCFVNINDYFYSRQSFKTYDDLENIRKSGYLVFEKGPGDHFQSIYDTYVESDDYYKQGIARKNCTPGISGQARLIMQTSVDKLTTSFGGLTSHLATYMRISNGENIQLGVFGRLTKPNEQFFQIKPFAVWM